MRSAGHKARVIVILTGAIGLSSITRHISQIIDLEMSRGWKPDPIFDDPALHDCVQYLRQACDTILTRHDKKCIDIGKSTTDSLCYSATRRWSSESRLGEEVTDKGVLHFLPLGLIWYSEEQREDNTPKHIYVPLNNV